jgi:hypothetical protein
MRKRTAPPPRQQRPAGSPKQTSGLMVRAEVAPRSAKTGCALDNHSHRTTCASAAGDRARARTDLCSIQRSRGVPLTPNPALPRPVGCMRASERETRKRVDASRGPPAWSGRPRWDARHPRDSRRPTSHASACAGGTRTWVRRRGPPRVTGDSAAYADDAMRCLGHPARWVSCSSHSG